MEQTTIFLKQATAKTNTEGILSEMALEVKKDEDGVNKVEGSITIKTDDINYTTYRINSRAVTRAGSASKSYENIIAFMERAHSIADVGEQEASRVRVAGRLNPWTSFNQMGNKNHGLGYQTGFVSIISEPKESYHSTFEVECFVQSVDDEFDKDTQVPTGRAILHTLLPIYNNGIEPLDIMVPQEHAMACKQLFTQPGCQSAHIFGDIGNTEETQTNTIQCQIGGAVTETKTKRVNELILTNAGTMEQQYELETIQRAIAEYDLVLESKKKRAMEGNNAGGNKAVGGATVGAGAATGTHRTFGF